MKLLWLCVLLSSPLVYAAGLQWEKTETKIEVAPLAESADAEFAFKNASARSITVRKVSGSCDCISAQTDKTLYAPGETGILKARYFYDGVPVDYSREVVVETDDTETPALLVLHLTGPGVGRAAAREATWPLNASDEKFVDLIPNPDLQVTFSNPASSSDKFAVRLLPGDGTLPARVGIRPLNISKATASVIRVLARESGGRQITLSVNAWVH